MTTVQWVDVLTILVILGPTFVGLCIGGGDR